jgi:glycosyltransferase involved in cell wall biosynthesis
MERDTPLMESLGINSDDRVFIFAGRLVGWKGVKYIVDAMKSPLVRDLPAKLLIVGDGPEKDKLVSQSSSAGLSERIIFSDFIPHDELARYYSVADAAIYPSIGDEAFGISIAEAMACGKPVIAAYIGGIPEVVGTDGRCGFLVSPTKSDEIAEKITLLTEQTEMRLRMAENARQRILNTFTWEKSADRLLTELQKI